MTDVPPEHRLVVLVLDRARRRLLADDPDGATLVEQHGIVVVSPEQVTVQHSGIRTVDGTLFTPGHVYLQSPDDQSLYASEEQAPEEFAARRHFNLIGVLQLLGARRVSFQELRSRRVDASTAVDGSVDRAGVKVSGGAKSEREERLRQRIEIDSEFVGGLPDVARAQKFARERGLSSDPCVISLIERRSDSNTMRSFKFQADLSASLRRSLQLAAGLKIPAVAGIQGKVRQHLRELLEYQVTLSVIF